MTVKKHINNVKKNGLTHIKNVFSQKEVLHFQQKSIKIMNDYENSGHSFSNHNRVLNCPFRFDDIFFKLVFIKKIDLILQGLIDEDYVLLNSNIINRTTDKSSKKKFRTIGDTWHNDSPRVGKKNVVNAYRFLVSILLDDFSSKNGSTLYVPKSHLKNTKPLRNYNYKSKFLTGKKGDVVIFDSGLWHKGGVPSDLRRLGVFNLYGPWWIKPYFNFQQMIGKKGDKLNKYLKKTLHYNSLPPKNNEVRGLTVTKL